jgi:transcription elongation factor Elf1
MAKAKLAKVKTEPKELKLVCKCGSCTHWEVTLRFDKDHKNEREVLVCVSCSKEYPCYFSIGPHEGLHYEKHNKGDEKKVDVGNRR